ncbi:DUF2924 domain-containing protein [Devosia ginsengisoli]|uniref:DUF2924 domain-containing protein n=1 Tax=Devosia ginsengisoli TaxID=400770 RepID=UPI0026EB6B8D|nr:DUF2924 domain-containing protein [Devosia ginsengisoli]MCR6670741.1 DUF2924 domain-containing protein [Devosia ginsengisoli]
MKRRTPAEIERDVESLRELDIQMLRMRWKEILKSEPPPKMQSAFLRLAIAYRLQELAYGGLKPHTLRQLRKYATSDTTRSSDAGLIPKVTVFDAQRSLSPGTRLMREWNGSTELVDVVEHGFVWRGTVYKTLSAAAVAITGTKWSGPRFFGLLPPKAANAKKPVGADTPSIQNEGVAA